MDQSFNIKGFVRATLQIERLSKKKELKILYSKKQKHLFLI